MRRLALLPLVMLVFACNDSTLVQPEDSADLQIAAKTTRNPHNPFVGVWWGIDPDETSSTHNLTIGHENAHGEMPVNLRTSANPPWLCDGDPIRSRGMTGQIVAENVLELFNLVFFCKDGTRFDWTGLIPPLGYVYDPGTDTLCYTFLDELPEVECLPTLYRKKPWKD